MSYCILIGIMMGVVLAYGGVYAVTTIMGSNIIYSNVNSGLSSSNVQGAIDELYDKAENLKKVRYAYGDPDKVTSYTSYEEVVYRLGHSVFIAKDGTQKLGCIYRNNQLTCFNPKYFLSEKEKLKQIYASCVETNNEFQCGYNDNADSQFTEDVRCSLGGDSANYRFIYCVSSNGDNIFLYEDGQVRYP